MSRPTSKQLEFLADLALELGTAPPRIDTSADAADAIDTLLLRLGRKPRSHRAAPKKRERQRPAAAKRATAKQLDYLYRLATRAGVPVPEVSTRAEAAKAIAGFVESLPPTRAQLAQVAAEALELDVRVPPPATRADAARDLKALAAWRRSRDELPVGTGEPS